MRTTLRVLGALALVVVLGPPRALSAADSKDIEATPQAKAYRESVKAIDSGDVKAYAKTLSTEANKDMEKVARDMGKTPKDLMELLKILQPGGVQLADLQVDGRKATMTATGKSDAETMYGTIELEEESGQWKVRRQKWSNTKK